MSADPSADAFAAGLVEQRDRRARAAEPLPSDPPKVFGLRTQALDESPGNGTRYRIVLVTREIAPRTIHRGEHWERIPGEAARRLVPAGPHTIPGGTAVVCLALPDFFWCAGDFGVGPVSAEWLSNHSEGRISDADAEAIAAIVNRATGWAR